MLSHNQNYTKTKKMKKMKINKIKDLNLLFALKLLNQSILTLYFTIVRI